MFSVPYDTVSSDLHPADSLHGAATVSGHAGESDNLFSGLLHHVYDSHEIEIPLIGPVHLPQFEPVNIFGMSIDLSPTKHLIFLWLAAIVTAIFEKKTGVMKTTTPVSFID